MTITDFLEARIADNETQAHNVTLFMLDPDTHQPVNRAIKERVLADCAAKRAIVNLHNQAHYMLFDGGTERIDHPSPSSYTECYADGEGWPCLTMRHLATAYANHPDYNEEWKP